MFQTVVDIFTRFFSPFLPTEWRYQNKRTREDDLLESEDEDPPIKKIRMNSKGEAAGSSYFPNPFFNKTRDKCSQTSDMIKLDSSTVCETICLDDTSSSSPDNGKSSILKVSQLENISPSKNKFRAPAHCRSPIKTKFKYVSSKRGGNDVSYVGTFSAISSSNTDLPSSGDSKRPIIRRIGSTPKAYSSRTELINNLAMRNQGSLQSSAMYDFQNKMKYGELLGKVLKSPEMFSCSPSSKASFTSSKVIDLTIDSPSSSKYDSRTDSNVTRKSSSYIDLTEPSSTKVQPSSSSSAHEIIDLDSDVIPVGTFVAHRRIVPPVNTLSSKLKHVPCTSDDFISNLVADVENCKKDFMNDRKQLVKEISSLSPLRKQFEKALEERLRRHLKITSIDLEEDEEAEVAPVKPQLTQEMMNNVMYAWDPKKPKGQVLVNNFNYQIKRADLLTLSGLNWLNDEVINFYMELLMVRGKEKSFPSVHCFSTFFYSKLIKDGYTSLKRWTRKIDLFSYDIVVVPIHLKVHWCLAIVDFEKKKITYFDSMGQPNDICVNSLLDYLSSEHMDKKKESFDKTGWQLICTKDKVPQQMNSCDCGVFACTFAEYGTRKACYDFSQDDMPYFRRKMTYEILTSSLLTWS